MQLLEAAAHQAAAAQSKTVPTVDMAAAEFLAWEKRRGVSDRHYRDLASRLKPFRAAFPCRIDELTVPMVDTWLDGLRWRNRTRNNYLNALSNFTTWCRRVKQYTKVEFCLSKSIEVPSENEIWTPDQMRLLLDTASARWPELVPHLAIGAFAKVRTSEIQRADWRQIRFDQGVIVIRRGHSKVRRTRKIVMPKNLIEWLKPHAKLAGPIVTCSNLHRSLRRLADYVGLKWKRNGLRNSASTYHAILTNDLNLVSREAGNSPSVLEAEYLEMIGATAAQAAEWFDINPSTGAVLITLPLFGKSQ